MAARFEQKEIRLLLTGKTGCGKSLLANSVFNEKIFKAKCQPASVTKKCQSHSQMIQGTAVTVIDTPGFLDTNNDIDIHSEMANCIELSIPGPHVILNVVSIGRFTQEDFNAITFFKEKFGDDVSKYCLLVLTRFDDYKRDTGMTDFNFESFITHLPLEYQSMLKKTFGNRYMPFDNTLSGNSGRDQVLKLIKKVNKIIADNNDSHYTNKDFEKAEKAMKRRKEEELEKERSRSFSLHDFLNNVGPFVANVTTAMRIFNSFFGNRDSQGNAPESSRPSIYGCLDFHRNLLKKENEKLKLNKIINKNI